MQKTRHGILLLSLTKILMIYVILEALDLQYVKQFILNKIELFKIFKYIYIYIYIYIYLQQIPNFFCGFKESVIRFRDFASSYNYNSIQSFQTLRFGSRARRISKKMTTHLTTILERQNFYMLLSHATHVRLACDRMRRTQKIPSRLRDTK